MQRWHSVHLVHTAPDNGQLFDPPRVPDTWHITLRVHSLDWGEGATSRLNCTAGRSTTNFLGLPQRTRTDQTRSDQTTVKLWSFWSLERGQIGGGIVFKLWSCWIKLWLHWSQIGFLLAVKLWWHCGHIYLIRGKIGVKLNLFGE